MGRKPGSLNGLLGLVWVLAATACAAPEPASLPQPPEGAVAGDFSSGPCIYTARKLEYAAECGVLIVPENRNNPDSRLIALPVTRVLSFADEPVEPVFWLTGGPGQSNLYLSRAADYLPTHDVVLMGYRGVDGGVNMVCGEVAAALGGGLLSQPGMDRLANAYRQCAERLASEGIDTNGYTVLEVIDDLEATRQALGYERINLESASYGTRLALIYDWRYPDRVNRSAMVGVNPPGHFWWDPELLDEQLVRYGELCAADSYCSSRTDDLAGLMRRVASNMPDHWLVFPVDRDSVLFGSFVALYQTSAAASVFDMWMAADEGDASGFALMTLAFPMMAPAGFAWGDSISKALSTDYDYIPGHDYLPEVTPGPSIMGTPASVLGWAGSAGWPVNRIAEEYRQVRPSSTRTLMLSGSLDVSTPYQTSRDELLPAMENTVQVVLAEAAHTSDLYYQQPEATRDMLVGFFNTGEIDTSAFTPQRVEFHTQWGFPLIAKLALGGVALLVLFLAFMVRWVWGFLRRR